MNSLDGNFWLEFVEKTQKLSTPFLFNNILITEELQFIEEKIKEIIITLCNLQTQEYGFRIYKNGVSLEIDEMKNIYNNSPKIDESLEKWGQNLFGNEYGILINKAEKFNVDLTNFIALKIKDLLDLVGFPIEGISFTLFIGNYGKTPIGIHKDPEGQDVIHFHLGPNNKVLHLWSPTIFTNYCEDSDLYAHSQKFILQKGDIFFMPDNIFHIGEQSGFSIALTIWRYNHTQKTLPLKLNEILMDNLFDNSTTKLNSDKNPLEDYRNLDKILISPEIKNSYENLLRETYVDFRYIIHSNYGFRSSPLLKNTNIQTDRDFQIIYPFQILYRIEKQNNLLFVYLRGNKIILSYANSIIEAIKLLNSGERIAYQNIEKILIDEFNKEQIYNIINLFYINNILKIS